MRGVLHLTGADRPQTSQQRNRCHPGWGGGRRESPLPWGTWESPGLEGVGRVYEGGMRGGQAQRASGGRKAGAAGDVARGCGTWPCGRSPASRRGRQGTGPRGAAEDHPQRSAAVLTGGRRATVRRPRQGGEGRAACGSPGLCGTLRQDTLNRLATGPGQSALPLAHRPRGGGTNTVFIKEIPVAGSQILPSPLPELHPIPRLHGGPELCSPTDISPSSDSLT